MAGPRRQFLAILVGGILASAGVSHLLRRRPMPLETTPLPGLPGFRQLDAGAVSGDAFDPLIGLDAGEAPPAGDLNDLFTTPALPGQVPVAVFTDYNCPYCRVLTRLVAEEAAAGGIAVTWHELPLLGPMSIAAAKAALAAELQGGYLPFHQAMMRRRFRPTAPYLTEAAQELGLDPARLLADMESPAVAARLRRSAGLASIFGIVGTPAMVVGRTLVLGEISPSQFRRLIEMERAG